MVSCQYSFLCCKGWDAKKVCKQGRDDEYSKPYPCIFLRVRPRMSNPRMSNPRMSNPRMSNPIMSYKMWVHVRKMSNALIILGLIPFYTTVVL